MDEIDEDFISSFQTFLEMKLSFIFCVLALSAAHVTAQTSCAGKKVLADFDSLVKHFSDALNEKYTFLLDELQERMLSYHKAYSSAQSQLGGIMREISVGRNFSAFYPYLTVSNHVVSVKSDLDHNTTRTRFSDAFDKPFVTTVAAATIRHTAVAVAADNNPEYAKCWDDIREISVSAFQDILLTQNSDIVGKNFKELNDKLHSLACQTDELVAKIDHDLCACHGSGRPACVDNYVSLKLEFPHVHE